jgi:hypothetical protein
MLCNRRDIALNDPGETSDADDLPLADLSGEQIKIPARTRLRFTPAKALKELVLGVAAAPAAKKKPASKPKTAAAKVARKCTRTAWSIASSAMAHSPKWRVSSPGPAGRDHCSSGLSRERRGAMPPDKNPLRRCAIYTRKSSEEGLEQDFNSLQAQREACEAFIQSQAGG